MQNRPYYHDGTKLFSLPCPHPTFLLVLIKVIFLFLNNFPKTDTVPKENISKNNVPQKTHRGKSHLPIAEMSPEQFLVSAALSRPLAASSICCCGRSASWLPLQLGSRDLLQLSLCSATAAARPQKQGKFFNFNLGEI